MNDLVRCNKLMGVYWLKGPLDDLQIKIILKPPEDIISLPKFEDYTTDTGNLTVEKTIEEYTLKWQEKIFSQSDIQRYKDVHNCITENELRFHEVIINTEVSGSKVFSYVHEDYFMPVPEEKSCNVSWISLIMERLNDVVGRIGDAIGDKSDSERHLFKSQDDVREEDDKWIAMHVAFDYSHYNDETVLKQEAVLLSMYHNIKHNYIILKPDVNQLETNPYIVENSSGEFLGHQYEIRVDFGQKQGGEELEDLLSKLQLKWSKKHKQLINFIMPPLGKNQYCLQLDLVSASNFERDNLYVQYNIKLPDGIHCNDTLHGRTHIAESVRIDNTNVCHFGYLLELSLEMDSGIDPSSLTIYLEAISTDFWRRHRTEGYTYLKLPLTPGSRSQELRCIRPDEKGADDRRFFLGGCHLIKDLEVLSRPELQNGDYTVTETGSITIRYSIISHSSLPSSSAVHPSCSTASALLQGAEAALSKYRRARARLQHATTAQTTV